MKCRTLQQITKSCCRYLSGYIQFNHCGETHYIKWWNFSNYYPFYREDDPNKALGEYTLLEGLAGNIPMVIKKRHDGYLKCVASVQNRSISHINSTSSNLHYLKVIGESLYLYAYKQLLTISLCCLYSLLIIFLNKTVSLCFTLCCYGLKKNITVFVFEVGGWSLGKKAVSLNKHSRCSESAPGSQPVLVSVLQSRWKVHGSSIQVQMTSLREKHFS